MGLDCLVEEVTPPSVTEVRSLVRVKALQHWQSDWENSHNSFRYRVDPVLCAVPRRSGSRAQQVLQTRLRLGVLKTRSWRRLVLKEQGEACDCGSVETVQHILFDCPLYARARAGVADKIGCPLGHNALLGRKSTSKMPYLSRLRLAVEFLRETGVLERLR